MQGVGRRRGRQGGDPSVRRRASIRRPAALRCLRKDFRNALQALQAPGSAGLWRGTSTAAPCSQQSVHQRVLDRVGALPGRRAHLDSERLDNAPPPAQVVREHVVHGAQRHVYPLSRSPPRAGPRQTPQLPVQTLAGSLALDVRGYRAARRGEAQGKPQLACKVGNVAPCQQKKQEGEEEDARC